MAFIEYTKLTLSSIFIIFSGILLTGCIPSSAGTGAAFQRSDPIPDKATIFHYRLDNFVGKAVTEYVLSNEQPMAKIGNNGYYKEIRKSGLIIYKNKSHVDRGWMGILNDGIMNITSFYGEAYKFKSEAGKVYYIRWQFNGPVEVNHDEAMKEIKGLKRFPKLTKDEM